MKKRNKRFSVLPVPAAVFLCFALVVACGDKKGGDPSSPDGGTDGSISFTVAPSGTPTNKLTLTFSAAVTGLSAADITLNAGSTGAVKGALTGSGTVYDLAISGVTTAENITVLVSKTGYTFNPASGTVAVVVSSGPLDTPVTFSDLTPGGSPTTDKLTLTFSAVVDGLSAADITLSAGRTGAAKGALTSTGGGVYELAVTGITSNGTVIVSVSKSGYAFTPASRDVTVVSPNFTVWFNTNFAEQSVASQTVTTGSTITAPAETLTKDGFTFKGWYKDYGVDPATGLWKYDDDKKWDFDSDTVTQNRTLYAGWEGGKKRVPRSWIHGNQENHLQGQVIELIAGKTYKMGARYYVQPNWGPVYLQARYYSSGQVTEKSITLQSVLNEPCFKKAEDEFTASSTGWYFIGISNYTAGVTEHGGQVVLHEVWLKEKGGGDINLLPYGDFVWKDTAGGPNTVGKFQTMTWQAPPFDSTAARREEWKPGYWNMNCNWDLNNNWVHMARDWAPYIGNVLNQLTGGVIANGSYTSLQFPKPDHP